MPVGDDTFNLSIETASREGVIALGRGDELLEVAALPTGRRHNIELTPGIAALCGAHGLGPAQLAEVYLSLGPGSFTGLRIAVATVKMLALVHGTRVVGVPTLDALRLRFPDAMVCLHIKRGSAWCAGPGFEPALRSLESISASGLPVVGEMIAGAEPPVFGVEPVRQIGRRLAVAGRFDDPAALAPLYIREPEAVTLWDQRHGPSV